jgi:hypothetical protein
MPRGGLNSAKRAWTSAEDAVIARLYPTTPKEVIGAKLNRGAPAVGLRASQLGIRKVRPEPKGTRKCSCGGKKEFYSRRCGKCAGMSGFGNTAKTCLGCSKEFRVKNSHLTKVFYCSKLCMATSYKTRLRGKNNPNFKGVGFKLCQHCKSEYHSYDKNRKYCSHSCYAKVASMTMPKYAPRRDNNHGEIIAAFKKLGCAVMDTSRQGGGFPDLLVAHRQNIRMVEIKNPKTSYGKKGLSKSQVAFSETGIKVHIVRTLDDVQNLVAEWARENLPPPKVINQSTRKRHRGFPVSVVSTPEEALAVIGVTK